VQRLQRIKKIAASWILPRSEHIPDKYIGVVTAFPFSYSIGRLIKELCINNQITGAGGRILIVGAHGGRDYFWLTGFGFNVDMLDLGHHEWGKATYLGDACQEDTWSKISIRYEMVIFCDVLEHLPRDFEALCYARKVLTENGSIFLTVPYKNDKEETHVRSYSRKTICRLVSEAGYAIEKIYDRPGLLEAFQRTMNSFNYGLALLMPTDRLGARMLRGCLRAEYRLNHMSRHPFRRFGISTYKGIMLTARVDHACASDGYISANAKKFVLSNERAPLSCIGNMPCDSLYEKER
jgi:hypothetical protein